MEHLTKIFRYPIETVLIIASISITFASFFIFSEQKNAPTDSVIIESEKNIIEEDQTITIDLSGSVEKPDVYSIPADFSLSDVIKKAGGFSKDADKNYISRSINLARNLHDKEKVYIPSKNDIEDGYINTESTVLGNSTQTLEEQSNPNAISINSASEEELDSLPGIGPVSAKKIIDNRPYETIEELISKKAVNNSTYEKMKDLISL